MLINIWNWTTLNWRWRADLPPHTTVERLRRLCKQKHISILLERTTADHLDDASLDEANYDVWLAQDDDELMELMDVSDLVDHTRDARGEYHLCVNVTRTSITTAAATAPMLTQNTIQYIAPPVV